MGGGTNFTLFFDPISVETSPVKTKPVKLHRKLSVKIGATLAEKLAKFIFAQTKNKEVRKVAQKTFIECLKTYYALMVNGGAGGHGGMNIKELKDKKNVKERYFHLLKTMDKNEQRLPLWLALDEQDQLNMFIHQYIDSEAESLYLLLLEEIEN